MNTHNHRCVCRYIGSRRQRARHLRKINRVIVLLNLLVDQIFLMQNNITRLLFKLQHSGTDCELISIACSNRYSKVLQACAIIMRRQLATGSMGGSYKVCLAEELLRLVPLTAVQNERNVAAAHNLVVQKYRRYCRMGRRLIRNIERGIADIAHLQFIDNLNA